MLTRGEQVSHKICELLEWANELTDPAIYPDNIWNSYRELFESLKELRVSYED